MITRILIVVGLVLSRGFCLAEDLPEDTKEIKSLTTDQAAELVAEANQRGDQILSLISLTSINKDVARELAKFKGGVKPEGQTSTDEDASPEGSGFIKTLQSPRQNSKPRHSIYLGLTSINKDVAQELANFDGLELRFTGAFSCRLSSIDKDSAQALAKFRGTLYLLSLPSIDQDVAQEFAKFKGRCLQLGLTSWDRDVWEILKSNYPRIDNQVLYFSQYPSRQEQQKYKDIGIFFKN